MSDIQKITADGHTLAIIGRKSPVDGIRFLTEESDPLQVGIMERSKGYMVKPHRHPNRKVIVESIGEFFYVENGRVRLTIFNDDWKEVASEEVKTGEFALILGGGHSVEFLEDTRIHEVKQGPYPGDASAKEFHRTIA